MCLYVKTGCKPEIATKDITCWKAVEDRGENWEPWIYTFKKGYSYPYNKVLTAESYGKGYIKGEIRPIQHLELKQYYDDYPIIEEGFHANRNKTCLCTNLCIIPKGTEYCLGETNDIVAVNMIVFRSMRCYYWYRIKKLWQEKMQIVFNKNK